MTSAAMITIVNDSAQRLRLVLAGTIDVSVSGELLQNALQVANAEQDLIVDLEEALYLDCSAAQILLALQTSLDVRGKSLQLHGVSPGVRRWLTQLGVVESFTLTSTPQGAARQQLAGTLC